MQKKSRIMNNREMKKITKTVWYSIYMKSLHSLSFILLLCIAANLNAQSPTPAQQKAFKKNFKTGTILMNGGTSDRKNDEHLIDTTLSYFLNCYKEDSTNANVAYIIGKLYLSTAMHKAASLPYEERAIKNIKKKYFPDDASEKHAPPLAYYWLARAQHVNYQFDNAINNFNTFKKMIKPSGPRPADIDYWVACCNNAKGFMLSPCECKVIDMGDVINSVYDDYAPVITADESEMYFTSRRPLVEDTSHFNREGIWLSLAGRGGMWGAPSDPGPPLNQIGGNSATVSLTPDGQIILDYESGSITKGTLFISRLSGNSWSKPRLIDSTNMYVDTKDYSTPSACLSPDGKTLYFSSDRPGGTGGLDLYQADMGANGIWGSPVNMGTTINTKYDEDAPFVSFDGSLLFFSSKGHNTMGGYDVFMSKGGKGNWGAPTNLGWPINTPDDDKYFVLSADGKRGYYNTVRLGTMGERDIYEVVFDTPFPVECVGVLVAYVKTPSGGAIPSSTKVTCSGGGTSFTVPVNTASGKFLAVLKADVTYSIVITSEGKTTNSYTYTIPRDSSTCKGKKSFYNGPITLGDKTDVFNAPPKPVTPPVVSTDTSKTNVNNNNNTFGSEPYFVKYFGYNLDNVTPKDPDFSTLVRNINNASKNGKIVVYIESSASTVPTKKWGSNDKLASARAQSLKRALTAALSKDNTPAKGKKEKGKSMKPANNMANIKFELSPSVNGPEYAKDAKNIEKYRKFQYVKGYIRDKETMNKNEGMNNSMNMAGTKKTGHTTKNGSIHKSSTSTTAGSVNKTTTKHKIKGKHKKKTTTTTTTPVQ
jgi:WD40-like Beta Propeller Repeat